MLNGPTCNDMDDRQICGRVKVYRKCSWYMVVTHVRFPLMRPSMLPRNGSKICSVLVNSYWRVMCATAGREYPVIVSPV
jgi:hypothetical protein